MRLFGVGAHEQDHLSVFADIGNGIGHCAGAERALQAGNRWSVADAGTVVNVVGLKNRARHLLEHVDVFIGRTRAGKSCDGAPAVPGLDFAEAPRNQVERLIPGGGFKFPGDFAADEGRRQALRRVNKVKARRSSFHAEKPVIGRTVLGFSVDNAAVFHHEVVLAPGSAVRTGRPHALDFPRTVLAAALHGDGACWAGPCAVAAGLAVRAFPVFAERRKNGCAYAPAAGDQGVVACSVVAGAYAALAANAERGIKGNEGVRVEDRSPGGLDVKRRRFNPELSAAVLQFAAAVFRTAETVLGGVESVVGDDELECRAACRSNRIRIGVHDHAGLDEGVAGGYKAGGAFDLNHAEPAGANGAHILQVAQRRNMKTGAARSLENGGAFLDGDNPAVDRKVKHIGFSRRRTHLHRNSRSAGSGRILAALLHCSCRFRLH